MDAGLGAFIAFITVVVLVFTAVIFFLLGRGNTVPSDSFRSVCIVQGGTPYVGTDRPNHYPAVCVKGGTVISVPVVK